MQKGRISKKPLIRAELQGSRVRMTSQLATILVTQFMHAVMVVKNGQIHSSRV